MTKRITIIHHFDAEGADTFHAPAGIDIEVLTVDERAPGDRVYRRDLTFEAPDALARIIGDPDIIGHSGDARHEAIRRRVLGLPLVKVVKGEESQ